MPWPVAWSVAWSVVVLQTCNAGLFHTNSPLTITVLWSVK